MKRRDVAGAGGSQQDDHARDRGPAAAVADLRAEGGGKEEEMEEGGMGGNRPERGICGPVSGHDLCPRVMDEKGSICRNPEIRRLTSRS